MAEGGFNAGNAFITVSPDMSSFAKEIQSQMAEEGDKAGKAFGDAFSTRLKASFADLPNAKITADADTAMATAELDDAAKNRTSKITVSVDKDALKELALPAAGIAGAAALGPSAVGAALGITGIGVSFVAAAADAGAFGVVAKGMFSDVTTAQKALTTAQTAYNKATTDQGRATALAAEKAALDGLTPAEQQLATQLTALSSAWSSLQKAQQPVVGAALTPWLQTATSGMQLLNPLITDGANAVQLLGVDAQQALAAPFWGTFFTTLGQTGEDALTTFGTAAGSVGDGLAHLFVTFAPDIDDLLPLVDKAATAFDKWAKSVTSGGLEDFFEKTFSPANVAALKTDLGDAATVVENIAKATASLSPTAFSGLSNLLAVAAKLSPGQIEALAGLYGASKAVGGAGNLTKLLTGGASLALPSIGGKKTTKAKTTAKGAPAEEEEPKSSAGSKIGSAAVGASGVLSIAAAVEAAAPAPDVTWLDSWAPYEKIFTNDLPKAWSISYEAFQVEFAGKLTAFFTESVPHLFTGQIPMGWDIAYQNFENGFGSPIAAWFTNSLPHFFTVAIPDIWSPIYENFERDVGSPLAGFFSSTLPSFFTGAGAELQGAGRDIGDGLVTGWNATSGAVTTAFGAAKNWVSGQFTGAASWLSAAGNDVATGFVRSWDADEAALSADFGKAKTWVTSEFTGAASWLSAAGTDTGSGFVKAFGATEATVTADAGKVKGWVTSEFTGAASWLSAAGTAVMGGFLSSLESEYTSVQNFVTSIAGWIAAHKGPVSDDYLLLQPAGQAIMGGFGDSLAASFASDVQPVIAGVAPAIASLSGIVSAQSLGALSALNIPSVASAPRLPGVSSPLSAGGPMQLQVTYGGTGNQLTDSIVSALRYNIQANNGGDVQAHLGQGQVRMPYGR